MRALVTGANGFAGRHLVETLRGSGHEVFAASGPEHVDGYHLRIDLSDLETIVRAVHESDPDVVFHLAGQAFVPTAIARPLQTYEINAMGTFRVLEAIQDYAARSKHTVGIVLASSASVYGSVAKENRPQREEDVMKPLDPYGASKAASEFACLAAYHAFGVKSVIARSFNHVGPMQDRRFVIPSFAIQLARIKAGIDPPVMHVGNLEAERDFLDVRDAVRGYATLAEYGVPGEIYNVCSGVPVSVQTVLRSLIEIAHVAVEVREDPTKMRVTEIKRSYGDNSKLLALGWKPTFSLDRSLREIFDEAFQEAERARVPL